MSMQSENRDRKPDPPVRQGGGRPNPGRPDSAGPRQSGPRFPRKNDPRPPTTGPRDTTPLTPRKERPEPVEGSWDHVADWYDSMVGEKGSEFHQAVIVPGVLKLLGLKPGDKVLDMACGQGAVANTLYRLGADVTGVDISPQLVRIAKERSPQEIKYHVADVRKLDMLPARSFDAIVSIMSAQNIDPVEPMFAECARLLRPGGRLVLVTSHPAFRIPRQTGWTWDEARQVQVRTVDRYLSPLKIPIDMRPFKRPSEQETWTYHRPIESYVTMMGDFGLWTNAMEGWTSHKHSESGPKAIAENVSRAEFPLFLAMRVVRVAEESAPVPLPLELPQAQKRARPEVARREAAAKAKGDQPKEVRIGNKTFTVTPKQKRGGGPPRH